MRSIALSADHYAAHWPVDQIHTPAQLTELGCRMAALPEGPEKEEKLLQILQCFHGYLVKYMGMILRGHVSHSNRQDRSAPGAFGINKDTRALLKILLPKAKKENKANLAAVCRTLHLAFRQMGPNEVFDVLMMCMLKSIRRYDPSFHVKIKQVADALTTTELYEAKKFSAADLNRYLDYDAARYLRYLAKRDFLVAHKQESSDVRYERSESWPPAPSFFAMGPIGLSYFATQWFRYHLIEFIDSRMSEVEAKQGFCQLRVTHTVEMGGVTEAGGNLIDRGIPTIQGNLLNPRTGYTTAADLSLLTLPVDIGELSLAWVHAPKPGLFFDLDKQDRFLLYYLFARELDMESIAHTLAIPVKEVKRRYQAILLTLQEKAGIYADAQAA